MLAHIRSLGFQDILWAYINCKRRKTGTTCIHYVTRMEIYQYITWHDFNFEPCNYCNEQLNKLLPCNYYYLLIIMPMIPF